MKLLNTIERRYPWFAIHNLTLFLVAGQAILFMLSMVKPEILNDFTLLPDAVYQGEFWRVITFIFIPTGGRSIFIIFTLMLLWIYGRTLESQWGHLRFNLYLLIGYSATALVSFLLFPHFTASNTYVQTSLFFAFAMFHPDFELRLFFILPVKIKWLAGLLALTFVYFFFKGELYTKLMIAAGFLNFFVFFSKDLLKRLFNKKRQSSNRSQWKEKSKVAAEIVILNSCSVCQANNKSHPERLFFYDEQQRCFCEQHKPKQ